MYLISGYTKYLRDLYNSKAKCQIILLNNGQWDWIDIFSKDGIQTVIRYVKYWSTSMCCALSLSCIWLFATPWTVAHQASLSMRILQARRLEWVAIPSSRASSKPRDQTQVSHIVGGFFTIWVTREVPRILEWVALPLSRGSSWPSDQTQVSCITGSFFTIWVTREVPRS